MKFLTLLILMTACGVHKTPLEKDLNDSDGDSISNYQEVGIEKYLSRVEALPEIRGIMSFGSSRISVTNVRDLRNDSMDLLTWNQKLIQEEEIFYEWTKLRLRIDEEIPLIKKGIHEVILDFESGEISPVSLWLVKDSSRKNLGPWSPRLTLKLSAEQLSDIIKGKSHLAFSTPWLEKESLAIKNKTYQVFMHNGEKVQVHYVSKELSFEDFLKDHNILEAHEGHKFDFYSVTDQIDNEKWWRRQISSSQHVLIYASPAELSRSYKKSLTHKSRKLSRINGKGSVITVKKPLEAKLYLDLSGYKTERKFRNESFKKKYSDYRFDIIYECKFHQTQIIGENRIKLDWKDFEQDVLIHIDGVKRHLEDVFEITYQMSQEEPLWLLSLKIPATDIKIELTSRSSATFVNTGLYKRECVPGHGPEVNVKRSNTEGVFELSLETYVEKL
jgi:hypothetical protein